MKRKPPTGTLLMFAGLAVAGVYSFMNQPVASSRRTFEADASGRLVEVDRPAARTKPAPSKRLFKPEPDDLLNPSRNLELTADQRERLALISLDWQKAKAELEQAIEESVSGLDRQGAASVPSLTSELGSYSKLSREFDFRREVAWRSALDILSATQRSRVMEELR